ncbi:MAG: hypothetical protein AAF658_07490 [Myxococcota bacterium]
MPTLRRSLSFLIGVTLLVAIGIGLGVSGREIIEHWSGLDLLLATSLVPIGLVQTWLLSERWRLWERRSGEHLSMLRAMDHTVSSTLVALTFGPFAGDLVRGQGAGNRVVHRPQHAQMLA